MAFKQWVKNCFDNIVDPDKDFEVEEITKILNEGIATKKRAFVLSEAIEGRSYKPKHLDKAKQDVYTRFLTRAWADGQVQESELQILAWVGNCLEISPTTLRAIHLERARPKFAEALAEAMDDGHISDAEVAKLNQIAKAGGMSLQVFVREFFQSEGEQFLRGIFTEKLAQNQPAIQALDQLVMTAGKLGISREVVLHAIKQQAVRFIEHALADAKEDNVLTELEESHLLQLLRTFDMPSDVKNYVTAEVKELRILTNIANGKLPTVTAPSSLNLKAGELVHHHGQAVWRQLKLLKSGPSTEHHDGMLTITDCRLLFNSSSRSESFGFASIVSYDTSRGVIELQLKSKPVQQFVTIEGSRIPAMVFHVAVKMANQVITNQDEKRRSRHIAREVRQRVRQRYSGRCAECDAADYLEFDHIVPVAKGGSNSEANVQLLCRGCNSRKSDMI
jgi:5-methylcytosine-specific restriction endonuclease McrA